MNLAKSQRGFRKVSLLRGKDIAHEDFLDIFRLQASTFDSSCAIVLAQLRMFVSNMM
tara:strand:- start:12504 stop:12674 length:171 start_codon:yes stop_codon:yes gene_type:complete